MSQDEIPVTQEGLEIYIKEMEKHLKPYLIKLKEAKKRLTLMSTRKI